VRGFVLVSSIFAFARWCHGSQDRTGQQGQKTGRGRCGVEVEGGMAEAGSVLHWGGWLVVEGFVLDLNEGQDLLGILPGRVDGWTDSDGAVLWPARRSSRCHGDSWLVYRRL
jgi:hypothetical protein